MHNGRKFFGQLVRKRHHAVRNLHHSAAGYSSLLLCPHADRHAGPRSGAMTNVGQRTERKAPLHLVAIDDAVALCGARSCLKRIDHEALH